MYYVYAEWRVLMTDEMFEIILSSCIFPSESVVDINDALASTYELAWHMRHRRCLAKVPAIKNRNYNRENRYRCAICALIAVLGFSCTLLITNTTCEQLHYTHTSTIIIIMQINSVCNFKTRNGERSHHWTTILLRLNNRLV